MERAHIAALLRDAPGDLHRSLRGTLAIILAGGKGRRLRELTENQSKPALPFGGKFRIIDFPLSNCVNSGIRHIAVVTQYRAHSLLQHVQQGWGFLRSELGYYVELWPAQQQTEEESWYRGTADAVYQNLRVVRAHSPEHVLILGGDHVYKQDYAVLLKDHIERQADVTIACHEVPRAQATRYGVVTVNASDRVTGFEEKPEEPAGIPDRPEVSLVSMGIYVFRASCLLEQLEWDAQEPMSSHDFGKDLLPHMARCRRVMAHRFSRSCVPNAGTREVYWRDVGTVDAYWAANMDLTAVTPALDLYDPAWPVWTYQVQRPGAKFVFDDDHRRGMAVDSVVSAGCVVSGSVVRRSLLFSDVRVNSYSLVEDSVILPGSSIGRRCRLKKVILDSYASLPEDTVIGDDPASDARRFYRTRSGVTLITPSMLEGQ